MANLGRLQIKVRKAAQATSGKEAFPALPAPAPLASAPVCPASAPALAPPASVAPVEKFLRGGGQLHYRTVRHLLLGCVCTFWPQNIYFEAGGGGGGSMDLCYIDCSRRISHELQQN